ncbi:purine-binding chemotaxis protein CheW [Clostridium acetobutylicum]|uniref:Chemotaxis signal transduction protein CheW n=1 Tax=Clostridium acetobutylicum (strain ATCC 824 / DSM 792 / JCM 1419 / IAM 19013 / LMG 5710 / NBRC 13948 / NRRL B-527 / VKM B-1787 / 2291 / W) TaxID=272562 RepID=Q97GZ8_CLOAB|nr:MULTISPECIES: chemotaxis protein CheW [Clostridium]AAK80174.1 Chemotaxis signal transduction protein CheW [Clostridium acetobutylicum ATCC 824]ADZ21268.1 Chemotaxis signal transduction protein CheW [Clostridium acetobutylicum EA 2018]AEI32236.1 chemotaxis signal transduction protein CheW [Clostridium acetobutylicum DSM 1731]AWV79400.1 chemotaxis protein CheW [Clostridium acetobutylicum]KHD38360.1 chemotaxis protein CheW [Clostridium acetobutylicum]
MQVVVFKLNDEQFAVETSRVQTIVESMTVTKVPKAPDYVKGLINIRGNVQSLLDINLLLDIDESECEDESIIILRLEEEPVGISVNQVDEVLDIDENLIEKVDDDKKDYVKGVINFKDRIVTLIDIDKLIKN